MTNRCGGSPCAGPPSWCARSRVACAVVSLIGSLLIGTDCRESLAPHGVDRNGGTVRSPDRVATLEIPEGALSQTTQITVSPESDSAGHGVLVAGTVYDFQPSGLQFAQPARLIIKYDPARLPAGVGPSQLKLMRSDSVWEQVPGSTVDSANETVWAPISGFTSYGIGLGLTTKTCTVVGSILVWPICSASIPELNLGQDYAEFNDGKAQYYHTGIDIAAPRFSPVVAAGDGQVVRIQLNAVGCAPGSGNCYDHGFGNTVIVRHSLTLYTQYSHLQQVDPALLLRCGTPDSMGRVTCSPPVPVKAATTQLGEVGCTNYGANSDPSVPCPATFGAHLHFEVKNFYWLGPGGDDASGPSADYWGYTPDRPDTYGYADPISYLHQGQLADGSVVGVTAFGNGASLRYGPSGYQPVANTVSAGDLFVRVRSATATLAPGCSGGWYEVRPISPNGRTYSWSLSGQVSLQFIDAAATGFNSQPATLPDAWVCAGNAGQEWLVATPDAPTNLAAAAVSSAQIGLTWQDNSSNEEGFQIERAPGGTADFGEIGTVGADVTSYQDQSLITRTAYSYRVRAYNAVGTSDYSNVATASTLSLGQINLQLASIPSNVTQVYAMLNGTISAKFVVSPGQTSLTGVIGLAQGTYTVQVVGSDASGSIVVGARAEGIVGGATTITVPLTLSPAQISLDPSTPSSVSAGSSFTFKVNLVDPAHWAEGAGVLASWRDPVASASLLSWGSCTAGTSPGQYTCSSTVTAPTTPGTMTVIFSVQKQDRVFFYAGAFRLSSNVTASIASGINLQLASIPSSVTQVYAMLNGTIGAKFVVSPGQTSLTAVIGVAQGTHTVQVVGSDTSGSIVVGAQAEGVVVGDTTIAVPLTLSPAQISLDPSTPSSVAAGSSFTFKVNLVDPAHWAEGAGVAATWRDPATSTSLLSWGSCTAGTSPGQYTCSSTVTAPTTPGTMTVNFSVQKLDRVFYAAGAFRLSSDVTVY